MKTIKLAIDALIGERHYLAGDLVSVPDDVATRYVRDHAASLATGPVENATDNHLADAISPAPPAGHAEWALNQAGSPTIDTAPGLVALKAAVDAGPPPAAAPKRTGGNKTP